MRHRSSAACLIKRAHEIALDVVADGLDAWRLRIETANTTIGTEPDHALAVRKDRVNVVRTESACGAVELALCLCI